MPICAKYINIFSLKKMQKITWEEGCFQISPLKSLLYQCFFTSIILSTKTQLRDFSQLVPLPIARHHHSPPLGKHRLSRLSLQKRTASPITFLAWPSEAHFYDSTYSPKVSTPKTVKKANAMASTKLSRKFNIVRLIVALSRYTELDNIFFYHFCTFIKTRLQLLFVNHDGILSMNLVIHVNAKKWSKDAKDSLRDAVLVTKSFFVYLY